MISVPNVTVILFEIREEHAALTDIGERYDRVHRKAVAIQHFGNRRQIVGACSGSREVGFSVPMNVNEGALRPE